MFLSISFSFCFLSLHTCAYVACPCMFHSLHTTTWPERWSELHHHDITIMNITITTSPSPAHKHTPEYYVQMHHSHLHLSIITTQCPASFVSPSILLLHSCPPRLLCVLSVCVCIRCRPIPRTILISELEYWSTRSGNDITMLYNMVLGLSLRHSVNAPNAH
uniref:Putative secreted protein n=1 Tax=Anopheles darlingi TaxID=43151 RepID=A0A2M4D4D6_ANODA